MAPAMAALAGKLAVGETAPYLDHPRNRLRFRPLAFVMLRFPSNRNPFDRLAALSLSEATQASLHDSDCCAHYQHVTRQTGKGNSDAPMIELRTASRCIPSPPRRLARSDTAGQ